MATLNLLYKKNFVINDYISIRIPRVEKILKCEDDYYSVVSMLTAMPVDLMVQLDDIGIDFAAINEWELFTFLFGTLKDCDTSLIFKGVDLKSFKPAIDPKNSNLIFVDPHTGAKIDRTIHREIANALRKIHHIDKNNRKPANNEAKAYMIERARSKQRRRRKRISDSQLESLIIALVNTEQFNYKFDDVRKLSIYQFNESVRQTISKIDYDNRMHGVYAGTISAKDLSQDDLNWLIHK